MYSSSDISDRYQKKIIEKCYNAVLFPVIRSFRWWFRGDLERKMVVDGTAKWRVFPVRLMTKSQVRSSGLRANRPHICSACPIDLCGAWRPDDVEE